MKPLQVLRRQTPPSTTALLVAGLAAMTWLPGCGLGPGPRVVPTGIADLTARTVPGHLLVKWRPGATGTGRFSALARTGLDPVEATADALARIGWSEVELPGDVRSLTGAIAALRQDPAVEQVEPSRVLVALEGQPSYDDPRAGEQYTLERIGTAAAHAVTEGSDRTLLAIVDTGVDDAHPDFRTRDGQASRVVRGENFVNLDGKPIDRNGHGTHCAGIAAATSRNAEGIVGQAPGVRILAEKVLGDNGAGSDAAVASGIIDAVNRGASVISLSLGGPDDVRVIADAIRYARDRGALLIAAMGNQGKNVKSYPAANEGVMAVGSTDEGDRLSAFSNTGDWISIVAPGDRILSTLPWNGGLRGRRYGVLSGTSMATPCVAGIAALVRDRHPDWDADRVRAHLERTALDLGEPGFDAQFGAGRLDAGRALSD
ncbi:MAG: S8 family serine peptidase [bacterium]|nr:S8 family serine peptidase [bacterium]